MKSIVDKVGKLPMHDYKRYEKRPLEAIDTLVIHHSLTDDIPGGGDVEAFARYHVKNNNWPGIGYHYVIDKDGTVYKTQDNSTWAYHAGKHNRTSLAICVVGDFRESKLEGEQRRALLEIIKEAHENYDLNVQDIKGHSELEGYEWKKCPCFDMEEIRKHFREEPEEQNSDLKQSSEEDSKKEEEEENDEQGKA